MTDQLPVVTTLSQPAREAYEAILNSPNNFFTATEDDIAKLRFLCKALEGGTVEKPKANPVDTARGVYRDSHGARLKIQIFGVVDPKNCKIGPYGNVEKDRSPTFNSLKKAKFHVALTFLRCDSKHPDAPVSTHILNMMARLSQMQDMVNERVMPAHRYNDCVRFMAKAKEVTGYMLLTLGLVYAPAVRASTAAELLKKSPMKEPTDEPEEPTLPDIVCDPLHHTSTVEGASDFKHNDQLPIFHLDGTRVGRTGDELSEHLYAGRWVKADCELVVWNIPDVDGAVRTFQLVVDKMTLYPRAPPADAPGLSYLPLTKIDCKDMKNLTGGKDADGDGIGKDGDAGSTASSATLSANESKRQLTPDAKETGSVKKARVEKSG